MPLFPTELLVDLAPYALQIRALHSKSRYSEDRSDEGMMAMYKLLLPALKAFLI